MSRRPITTGPEEHALSFFSLEGLGAACTNSQFDQEELIEVTIGLIRDSDKKIAAKGISLFRGIINDTLRTSGSLTTVSQTTNAAGTTTSATRRLLTRLSGSHAPSVRARPTIRPARTALEPGTLLSLPAGPPTDAAILDGSTEDGSTGDGGTPRGEGPLVATPSEPSPPAPPPSP